MTAARIATIAQLATNLRRRHPHLHDLDDIAHLCNELAHALPRAQAVTNPGDGLRSPNLTGGGRSIGSHAAPTEATALAHLAATGDPRALGPDTERAGRPPKATSIHAATTHLHQAEHSLRMALSVADDPDPFPTRSSDTDGGSGGNAGTYEPTGAPQEPG